MDGNMQMEPGYPKPLLSEFPGLTGNISAALAVPASGIQPEMVFFFKHGKQHMETRVDLQQQEPE